MTNIRYNNYHRHDHYSNIRTPDVIVKPQDYIDRILELEHTHYFTTNHGCSGNVFEAYDLCEKNGLKLVYGMEMYYTDDRHIKNKSSNTYHVVVIGLTKNAFYKINEISSLANTEGFYHKPRVDMELLLKLPSDEVVITSACTAGRLFKTDSYIEEFVLPLKDHFGDNFMLETQSHNHPDQIKWNKQVLELSKQYNIPLIHGCDSHYIYPEQAEDRMKFLNGKGMKYGAEDSFILDYPNSTTIYERYEAQGVLGKEEVSQVLKNTLIFDKAEDLGFDKEIKMPSIYPNEDVNKKLKNILNKKWRHERNNVAKSKRNEYKEQIKYEMDIIEKTNMANYFLLNERIIDKAVNEYGAVLSRTGRGSAPSFYINKLLRFTDIDRIDAEVPLYPTRFMSVTRINKTKSLVDIDYNFSDVRPVIKASKDILGEDGIYYMVAYGTMKESSAFRNLCRAYNLPMHEYNNVAKNLDKYKDDDKWKGIIEESKKYVGVIDSVAPSPCSFLLLDKPISKEIGLIKVGDEICCCIDGYTADAWKYLKNDYLTVSVWNIISKTFELIGKPIPSIKELKQLLNDKVWELYRTGTTATLNQADSDFATGLVKKYAPTNIAELSAWVAAIRPGFASLLERFLNRKEYTTGINSLDELLEDSFAYLLYQESIMKFLMWCGIKEDQTYDIIKKIAKKKFKENELKELKTKLSEGFEQKTGSQNGFEDVWQVVEDASAYSFNASHSLSVAYDSLYGAYLKANYPLQYYTVILNHYEGDTAKTNKIIHELGYFKIELKPIRFRYSNADYNFDKETNTIYQGIASIKYLNSIVAQELYELRDNEYEDFVNLLIDITENTSTNTKQMKILITLDFFEEFGNNKYLLDIYEKFCHRYKKTHKDATKEKRIVEIKEFVEGCENVALPIPNQVESELEYLGYIKTISPNIPLDYAIISDIETKYKNPMVTLYRINNGDTERVKVKIKDYDESPFKKFDMIKTIQVSMEGRWKKTEKGGWKQDHSDKEPILRKWSFVKFD